MNQSEMQAFLALYQEYRYKNQGEFYKNRHKEFEKAHAEATGISIVLMSLTVLAGGLQAITVIPAWIRLLCAIFAAVLPVLSTAITAYSSLYGFEQQSKLYDDTIVNLNYAEQDYKPNDSLEETQYAQHLRKYVAEVESVFHDEQGQWGQLAKRLKTQD